MFVFLTLEINFLLTNFRLFQSLASAYWFEICSPTTAILNNRFDIVKRIALVVVKTDGYLLKFVTI